MTCLTVVFQFTTHCELSHQREKEEENIIELFFNTFQFDITIHIIK